MDLAHFLPILFHGVIGLIIVWGKRNVAYYPYPRELPLRTAAPDRGDRLCLHPLARFSNPRLDQQLAVVDGTCDAKAGRRAFCSQQCRHYGRRNRAASSLGGARLCNRHPGLGLPLGQRPVDDGDHVGRVDRPPGPMVGHGLLRRLLAWPLAGAGLAALLRVLVLSYRYLNTNQVRGGPSFGSASRQEQTSWRNHR